MGEMAGFTGSLALAVAAGLEVPVATHLGQVGRSISRNDVMRTDLAVPQHVGEALASVVRSDGAIAQWRP